MPALNLKLKSPMLFRPQKLERTEGFSVFIALNFTAVNKCFVSVGVFSLELYMQLIASDNRCFSPSYLFYLSLFES